MTDMPPDPFGWAITLTDDGQWQPRSLTDGTELDPEPTKQAAVAAIAAHTPQGQRSQRSKT